MNNEAMITISDKAYKIELTDLVKKDLKRGRISKKSILETLEKNIDLLEKIQEDSFIIEDAQLNTLVSGYKDVDIIEVECAVYRENITKIVVKDR